MTKEEYRTPGPEDFLSATMVNKVINELHRRNEKFHKNIEYLPERFLEEYTVVSYHEHHVVCKASKGFLESFVYHDLYRLFGM